MLVIFGIQQYGTPADITTANSAWSTASTMFFVAACLSFIGAVVTAADAFTRFDHMMEKQVRTEVGRGMGGGGSEGSH